MDKLPPEVLHRVFIQLILPHRFACTLVCRKWQNVLMKYSLFYSIHLQEYRYDVNRMLNMFKQWPDRATQVMELEIELHSGLRFNIGTLLTMFPNARVIKLTAGHRTLSYFGQPIELTGLTSRVEYLTDFGQCGLLSQMLSSNVGGRIKALRLDLQYKSPASTILSQLKNLPVLRKLVLGLADITINDFELMHQNIPSIQDLSIMKMKFKSGAMPFNIVPATLLTRLTFHNNRILNEDTHAQVYQYMTKKYINLTGINYKDIVLDSYTQDKRKLVYENGVLGFLKLIGPISAKLSLFGIPDSLNVFETLDSVDSKLGHLILWNYHDKNILEYLSQSNQAKSIETLEIASSNVASVHCIRQMMVLTTLDIYNAKPVRLNNLLEACPPTLKKLIVRCFDCIIDPYDNKLPSIEVFIINTEVLTHELGNIISSCFPNLLNLKMKGKVTEDVHINIQSPDFQAATFTTTNIVYSGSPNHCFLFTCPGQTEPVYCHSCGQVGADGWYDRTIVPYEHIRYQPVLSIVCSTEKRVSLGYSFEILPV